MSENTTENVVTVENAPAGETADPKDPVTLVDAIFDIGLTWAAHGLKVAQGALVASGKTLETTARTLERLADELAKKDDRKNEKKAA